MKFWKFLQNLRYDNQKVQIFLVQPFSKINPRVDLLFKNCFNHYLQKSTLVLILFSKKLVFEPFQPLCWSYFPKINHYLQKSTLVLILFSKNWFQPLYSKINPCVDLAFPKLVSNHYIQKSTLVLILLWFRTIVFKKSTLLLIFFFKIRFSNHCLQKLTLMMISHVDSLSKISSRADHSSCGWSSSQKMISHLSFKWTFSFHFEDPICRQDQTNSFFSNLINFQLILLSLLVSFILFIFFDQVYINFIKFYQVLSIFPQFY